MTKIPLVVVPYDLIPDDVQQRRILWKLEDITNEYIKKMNEESEETGDGASDNKVAKGNKS